MHFTFNSTLIKEQVATWAARDARLKRWTPAMNALSGSTALVSDPRYAQAQLAMAQYYPGRGVPAAPVSMAERNLEQELEAGFEQISLWRTEGYYRELLE